MSRRCAVCGLSEESYRHSEEKRKQFCIGDFGAHPFDPAIPESEVKALVETWHKRRATFNPEERSTFADYCVKWCADELAALLEDKSNA